MAQRKQTDEASRTQVRTTYLLSQAWFALRNRVDGALKQHGVTGMQFTLLSVLAGRDDLSSAQLSRRFYITPQAMGQVLTTLEDAGWIRRTEDPANRRILRVTLTRAGHDLVRACDAEMREIEEDAFSGIASRDLAALRATLETIVGHLREVVANP